jgi:hypothetical protein
MMSVGLGHLVGVILWWAGRLSPLVTFLTARLPHFCPAASWRGMALGGP